MKLKQANREENWCVCGACVTKRAAWHYRPFNNSIQAPSAEAIIRCEIKEKDIPLPRGSPSCMQMQLLFETVKRKCELKFSKQSIDQAYVFLDTLDRKGLKYLWTWTLPSLSEFYSKVWIYSKVSCWSSSLLLLSGNVSLFSALRNQGWKEWCSWQIPWQYVNVELLSEGHIKWFVDDPCAVKHVCTYRSSNNFE